MNILFGVQATGNGHISRARKMMKELLDEGHEIQVLFSGRDPSELWDMEIFGDFWVYKGLTFVVENGRINTLKTALNLELRKFYRDIRSIKNTGYDLVISDYEPITSRLAKRWGLQCIGIGHQYAFEFDIPKVKFSPHQRLIMDMFAPVDVPIGLHWHHFGQPIFPPIIPELEPTDQNENAYLVYLPFDRWQNMLPFFQSFPDFKFNYFSPVENQIVRKNVTLHPFSRDGFLEKLKSCQGVITSAGFELASESIHLGKKVLVRPISGQYEQLCNGLALNQLGWGRSIKDWSHEHVESFLNQAAEPRRCYPNVAKFLAHWVSEGTFDQMDTKSQEIWSGIGVESLVHS